MKAHLFPTNHHPMQHNQLMNSALNSTLQSCAQNPVCVMMFAFLESNWSRLTSLPLITWSVMCKAALTRDTTTTALHSYSPSAAPLTVWLHVTFRSPSPTHHFPKHSPESAHRQVSVEIETIDRDRKPTRSRWWVWKQDCIFKPQDPHATFSCAGAQMFPLFLFRLFVLFFFTSMQFQKQQWGIKSFTSARN